jgi:uncharacterized membrane protein YgcG
VHLVAELAARNAELAARNAELTAAHNAELTARNAVAARDAELTAARNAVAARDAELTAARNAVAARDAELAARDAVIARLNLARTLESLKSKTHVAVHNKATEGGSLVEDAVAAWGKVLSVDESVLSRLLEDVRASSALSNAPSSYDQEPK